MLSSEITSNLQDAVDNIAVSAAPCPGKKKFRPARPSQSLVHKPYQCRVCGAKFFDKVNVELHCERRHNTTQQLWVEVGRGQDILPCTMGDVDRLTHDGVDQETNGLTQNTSDGDLSQSAGDLDPRAPSDVPQNISDMPSHMNVPPCDSNPPYTLNNPEGLQDENIQSSRMHQNNRYKCTECNVMFITEHQLQEHKKLVHQLVPNCVESPQIVFRQNGLSPVLNRNVVTSGHTNPSNSCQQYLPPNICNITDPNVATVSVRSTDNISNLSLNQPLLAPSYIFPTSYYTHDPNAPMQQTLVQPHVPYMQPQHAVHHQVMHHPSDMQQQHEAQQQQDQQQQHSDPQQMQHDQQTQQQSVAQQHQQVQHLHPQQHQDLLLPVQHQHPPPPSHHHHLSMQHPAPYSVHITHSATHHHTSVAPHYSSPATTDALPSHITVNTHMTTPDLSYSNNTNPSNNGNIPLEPTVSTPTTTVSNTYTVVSESSPISSRPPTKTEKIETHHPAAKWNMCGECGVKFIDLMNLELHVEKKHPSLKILGSVDFGDGTMCYKTGVYNNDDNNVKTYGKSSLKEMNKIPQRHSCILCSYSCSVLPSMVNHVISVHSLSGKSMIDSIKSEEGSPSKLNNQNTACRSESISSNKQPNKDDGKPVKAALSGENCCFLCHTSFRSSAELIRHRIKDKKHVCGVCCYVTCSRDVLSEHVTWEHNMSNTSEQDGVMFSDLAHTLTCWRCDEGFLKTSEFIEHLKTHGSLIARCEKCGKQDYNIANILIHMTTLHPDFINRLSVSVASKGKSLSCSYLQTLSGDLIDLSCLQSAESSSTASKSSNDDTTNNNANDSLKPVDENRINCTANALRDPDCNKAFACSQCMVCFYGSSSLESHLKQHQDCNSHSNLVIKRSPSEERTSPSLLPKTLAPRHATNSTSNNSLSKSASKKKSTKGKAINNDKKIGLFSVPLTCGFKCEECGLTKDTSDVIVNHIRKVHISGNLVHMVNGKRGAVKEYPIYIVTPISST